MLNLGLVQCDCSQTTGIPVVFIELLIDLNITFDHKSARKPPEFQGFWRDLLVIALSLVKCDCSQSMGIPGDSLKSICFKYDIQPDDCSQTTGIPRFREDMLRAQSGPCVV